MKFRLSFKTPDVLDQAFAEYMDTHCKDCEDYDPNCNACCVLEVEACNKLHAIQECADQFIRYGEYITVEFDTDLETAEVIPIRR